MRCDDCAKDIPKGKEVYSSKSELTGPVGPAGGSTETVQVVLCPACVKRRDRRELWIWVVVVGVFVAGLLILVRELSRML